MFHKYKEVYLGFLLSEQTDNVPQIPKGNVLLMEKLPSSSLSI